MSLARLGSRKKSLGFYFALAKKLKVQNAVTIIWISSKEYSRFADHGNLVSSPQKQPRRSSSKHEGKCTGRVQTVAWVLHAKIGCFVSWRLLPYLAMAKSFVFGQSP